MLNGTSSSLRAVSRKVAGTLDVLEQSVSGCHDCALSVTRTRTVFGSGDYMADLMVLGEGPGEEEDRKGIPFVGKAGQLLMRQLECIGRNRTNTYLCNVVKCRACDVTESGWKKNRTPHFDEIESCQPYLIKQAAALPNVRLIVGVGSCPGHWLLRKEAGATTIRQIKGKFFLTRLYRGLTPIPGIVTYHPSFLLREENAHYKAAVWEDWKLVRRYFQLIRDGKDPFEEFDLYSSEQVVDRNYHGTKYDRKPDLRPWGKPRPFQTDTWSKTIEKWT